MWRGWLLLVPACSFMPAAGSPSDAAHDGPIDTRPIVMPDAATCFGSGVVQVCPMTTPAGTLTVSGTLDTGSAAACRPFTAPMGMQPLDACLVTAASIIVTGTFTVTGSRPLVVLAGDTLSVDSGALLDVSSVRSPSRTGAGADAAACHAGTTGSYIAAGGGGAGGSFGDLGGAGGDGDGGASGGMPGAASSIDALHGGCAGTPGGGTVGGAGGAGGGAIALLAGRSLVLHGTINASGAGGGAGASLRCGGGGGGAGGMIVLDAPAVTGDGTLVANGGGGGEGASMTSGSPGAEPDPTSPMTGAPGGSGNSNAGNGGDGAAGSTTAGHPGHAGTNNDGGGGGGGGAGAIRIDAMTNNLTGARSP